ncbi:MAG TPA: pyridoxamine 5'-phosphate oxidase [Desulfobulbaceae bacterium]|nr:pyridoxamine 5'-phosphate oxidase [Desulfobulbaceae bacterium]
MNLNEYFSTASGTGFLATASAEGKPDIAVYSRPNIMEDGTLAFIMRDRLTHANLQENAHAVYAFIEKEGGYKGVRLFMQKVGEDTDKELIAQMTRRRLSPEEDAAKGPKFVVYFRVEKALPLVGGNELDPANL